MTGSLCGEGSCDRCEHCDGWKLAYSSGELPFDITRCEQCGDFKMKEYTGEPRSLVTIEYPGHDEIKDEIIRATAQQSLAASKWHGQGYCFVNGMRDITFEVPENQIELFVADMTAAGLHGRVQT
jgi:hypothetical protein